MQLKQAPTAQFGTVPFRSRNLRAISLRRTTQVAARSVVSQDDLVTGTDAQAREVATSADRPNRFDGAGGDGPNLTRKSQSKRTPVTRF
jgi:hypothetical protein